MAGNIEVVGQQLESLWVAGQRVWRLKVASL